MDPSPSAFFTDKVRECTTILRSFATPTKPEDVYAGEQWRKAHTHLLIIHTLRHIHDDCSRYPSCDLKDALGYAGLVVKMVMDYVAMKKDYYWPELTRRGQRLDPNPFEVTIWTQNATTALQSTIFPPLQAFLLQSQLYHETFSPSTLRAHLVKIGGPLAESFCHEVERLRPEAFRAVFGEGDVGEEGISALRLGVEEELKRRVDKFQFYPVLMSNIDPELQELILPLTWIQKEVIVPWVLTAKNRGYWEYARFPENLGYDKFREHKHTYD